MRFRNVGIVMGVLALLSPASEALAGYSLFGDAQIVQPGNNSPNAVQIRSTCPGGFPTCFINNSFTFGGVDFDIPAGITFADFQTLATDYMFTDGSCGGGSPRFVISLTNGTNSGDISVYLGPPPNYMFCPSNVWQSTGDLLEGVNPIDTSHLPAGTFYDPSGRGGSPASASSGAAWPSPAGGSSIRNSAKRCSNEAGARTTITAPSGSNDSSRTWASVCSSLRTGPGPSWEASRRCAGTT